MLDYEHLRRENEDLGLKLKEKSDLDEFEALERTTKKDQEVRDRNVKLKKNHTFLKSTFS